MTAFGLLGPLGTGERRRRVVVVGGGFGGLRSREGCGEPPPRSWSSTG
jgi:hypothetical protein